VVHGTWPFVDRDGPYLTNCWQSRADIRRRMVIKKTCPWTFHTLFSWLTQFP